MLFDSAFALKLNIAPALRRSAVPALRKQALARTPGLFSAFGLGLMAQCLASAQTPKVNAQSKTFFSGQALVKKTFMYKAPSLGPGAHVHAKGFKRQ
ncbi:MAG: hypothetical protein ACI9ON_000724 [Limisphaerales bacterium]